MSERLPWAKFSWTAWETDDGLALCSMAAQGFWMRLLCMAAKEGGYVVLGGKKPATAQSLAFLHRQSVEDVERWLAELEANEVFSRDGQGRIYSRRMMRDAKIAKRNQQNGKKGGNPSLRKGEEIPAWDNPSVPSGVKADKEEDGEEDKTPPKPPEGADLFGQDESLPEPKDDVREAFHLWNALAADYGLPIARDLTEGRRRAIGKRLKVAGLPGWREALEAVKVSPLCRGDNDRRWKADLDFVCQAKSFTRLREGGYGTGAGAKPGAQPAATVRAIFDGPPALRESVVAAAGPQFAIKYIDQCRWDGARRVLIAKTGFAADEIRNELRRWLAKNQVGVEVAGQMAGAAA